MTHSRSFLRRAGFIAALFGVLLTLLPATPASANHRQRQRELERLIQEKRALLQQAEAEETNLIEQLNASDRRRGILQLRIDSLNGRLRGARTQIAVFETRLDQLSVALRKKNKEIEVTVADLQEQTDRLNRRVAEAYMWVPSEPDVIPGVTSNIDDIVAESEYQAALVHSDELLIEMIERTKVRLDDQRATLEATQAEVEQKRAAIADRAREIVSARRELTGARGQMDAEIALKQSLLSRVRQQQEDYRRAIQSYTEESESIASFLRGAQSGQTVIQGRGGWLRWPVSGRISSPYGWRTHPIYGYRSFHSGIDIAAPHGTLVKAARFGQVIFTGYKGAYGNVVLIDHGSGIATMYAHLSKIYARNGDHVSTLEAIAAVGTTGWSTGPHLHFEVRAGGEPTNPMRWL